MPLVLTSLALGVAALGDVSRVGRIGGKALGFFLATTAVAVTVGLACSKPTFTHGRLSGRVIDRPIDSAIRQDPLTRRPAGVY